MFDTQAHRRKERALAAQIWADEAKRDEGRHAILATMFGIESTTKLKPPQWAPYLDRLEVLAGEKPRPPLPYPLDGGPTRKQLGAIRSLRKRIEWRHPDGPDVGFRRFVAATCFERGDEVYQQAWLNANASVESLPRSIIGTIIRRLTREAHYRPSGAGVPPAKQEAGKPALSAAEGMPAPQQEPLNAP